jgi:hypothetical protein
LLDPSIAGLVIPKAVLDEGFLSFWPARPRTPRPTRVVVDGKVIESDGKTVSAQHVLALDPFTVAVLTIHIEMLDPTLWPN